MKKQSQEYDLNRPWLTLDPWQVKYINAPPDQDCLLLVGRQSGKTTAMSIKSVKLCVKDFKKGEFVLVNSITEKQAYHMLAKALAYAEAVYPRLIDKSRDNKPTKHKIIFKNGTGILCYAAGETGEGLRGFTIKKLMPDEGSRMSEEYFIAVMPMLSVIHGSMDISSTPSGKKHKDGSEKYFYKCSKDKKFKKFYVSAEDCPRHSKEFLESQKKRLSSLAYAQEYLAVFLDKYFKRIFDDEWIKQVCIAKKPEEILLGDYFLGVDVAGLGKDDCTYEIFKKVVDLIIQVENIVENKNYTTDTSNKVIALNQAYDFIKIGIDDGGTGFGVFSELLDNEETRRKTVALNNSSRPTDYAEEKTKRLLKEEMYFTMMVLGEKKKLKLLDDEEVKASLSTIQYDEGKIWGYNSHIVEGAIRGVYLAAKAKNLNIFAHRF